MIAASIVLAALSWCPTEASAQEISYNCNTMIGIEIRGNSGQAPVGVYAWHEPRSIRQFPCDSVETEVETWMSYLQGQPSCHMGWLYGTACQHINFYMYPYFEWAEAQANYNVVAWGTFTGKSKNYLIRNRGEYAGYWLRQWDGTTYRDFGQPPPPGGGGGGEHVWSCGWNYMDGYEVWECWDPIILNIGKEHKKFDSYKISGPDDGVLFDINGDGSLERLSWPEKNSDLAFLALDRNGNGVIDNGLELFGDLTVPGRTTGFSALQALMNSNGDGEIDAQDAQFGDLLLWVDENRNGISEPDELTPASTRVVGIGLGYISTNYVDKNGNSFFYEGGAVMKEDKDKLQHAGHYHDAPRPVYDVFLRSRQP